MFFVFLWLKGSGFESLGLRVLGVVGAYGFGVWGGVGRGG